jgi:ferredoxin
MMGSTKRREQGLKDPALRKVMAEMGMESVPLYAHQSETRINYRRQIDEMAADFRVGPVGPNRREVTDPAAMAEEVKARARECGADLVGACAVEPVMIDEGVDCPFANVIAFAHHESYDKVIEGPEAVSNEAHRAYFMVAEVATEMVRWIRDDLGWDAAAHHNGGTYIQAIPAMWQCGWGELGKNGSLIHPVLGASFRPSFITTDLPLAFDSPMTFGVQDRCVNCQVCINNCPGDAIPNDYQVDGGVKRWLTDVEKCYPYSRLRKEYCHLCVDVCPYNAPNHREDYMTFMKGRKAEGYKTPKMAEAD